MTVQAMVGDKERCLEAGVDDYITKPIRSEELSELLKRYAPVTSTGKVLQLLEANGFELRRAEIEMVNEEKP